MSMSSWDDVTSAAPDLAKRVQDRFEATGLALLATLRRDGAPRISGIEPYFGLGNVWLGMMPGSRKARDLQRDDRIALHAATADKQMADGDAKIAGTAIEVTDDGQRAAYSRGFAEATGYDPNDTGDFHLFRLDVTEVVFLSIAPEGDAMLIERWSPGRPTETIRRT
jgi:Pyridoxamine 5'-phosphate oxidase